MLMSAPPKKTLTKRTRDPYTRTNAGPVFRSGKRSKAIGGSGMETSPYANTNPLHAILAVVEEHSPILNGTPLSEFLINHFSDFLSISGTVVTGIPGSGTYRFR